MKLLITAVGLLLVLGCTSPTSPEPVPDLATVSVSVTGTVVEPRIRYTNEEGGLTDWMIIEEEYPWTQTFQVPKGQYMEVSLRKVTYNGYCDLRLFYGEEIYHIKLEEPYGSVTLTLFIEADDE